MISIGIAGSLESPDQPLDGRRGVRSEYAVHSYANSRDRADGETWMSGCAVNRWSRAPTRRLLRCRPDGSYRFIVCAPRGASSLTRWRLPAGRSPVTGHQ
jgi:hypothetical protein